MTQNNEREVIEALHERDRLGFAVAEVIGKLDEIIEVGEDVEFNDFAHIAIPLELWNELKDALELMPERADNYTSPLNQAIPDGWKLVPIEPTDEMIEATGAKYDDIKQMTIANYKAMINAAPTTSLTSETNTEVGE